MGQVEILELLKKHRNKKFQSKEIGERLNIARSCVNNGLLKLKKYNMIQHTTKKKPKQSRKHYYQYKEGKL